MRKFVSKHFRWFSKKLKSDSVDSYSAQVSFFIIISFFPFMIFLLSLLESININGISLLNSVFDLLPDAAEKIFSGLFSQKTEPIAMLSISAVTTLWSSSMAMLALIKGLNSVFDVKETRNIIYLRFVSILYTAIFAVIIAFTALVLVFGNTIFGWIFGDYVPQAADFFRHFKFLITFGILAVFFTFSFKVIPRKSKIRLRYCIIGGSLSSVMWVVYSFLFSVFVENFGNYSAVYGSLATLVVLMLWMYFCMYIMFIGGETAVWLQTSGIIEDYRKFRAKKKK